MVSYSYKRDKKRKMPDKLRLKVRAAVSEISWLVTVVFQVNYRKHLSVKALLRLAVQQLIVEGLAFLATLNLPLLHSAESGSSFLAYLYQGVTV